MAEQLKVLTICGSLRKASYNAGLARSLPGLAPPDMTFVEAPPFETMPLYNHDIQEAAGFPPAAETWAEAIRAADGVVICSPEYNWSIPGPLKNALDWVSRMKENPFKDKPVALQSASSGQVGGARMQYHMRMVLTSIDALILGRPEIFVNFAAKKFDEKTGELTDPPTKDIVKLQLATFAKFIKRVRD
ncbi:MAG TPA: NADPH-dependent FMN reductase [Pseudolabrys sp.]|nr:NADPH-dependent FMN reductase [Pseudolabrys sp.]